MWIDCVVNEVCHRLPWGDIKDHIDIKCWCHPDVAEQGRLVIHWSQDGREFDEDDREFGH